MQVPKTPPPASAERVLGSVEVQAAPDGQMYSMSKGNTMVPLTFHVDPPRVGSGQPFAVVSLTTEQCCFVETCRGKTKDLFAAPLQNAQIIPTFHLLLTKKKKKKDCGFLCFNVALFSSSNTEKTLIFHHFLSLWLAAGWPRVTHAELLTTFHTTSTCMQPAPVNRTGLCVSTASLHNLLSKHLFCVQKGKDRKQKSPPPWLESDDYFPKTAQISQLIMKKDFFRGLLEIPKCRVLLVSSGC